MRGNLHARFWSRAGRGDPPGLGSEGHGDVCPLTRQAETGEVIPSSTVTRPPAASARPSLPLPAVAEAWALGYASQIPSERGRIMKTTVVLSGCIMLLLVLPCRMVLSAKPVAFATAATPPWPKARASLAAHRRRTRSSSSCCNNAYLFWMAFTTSGVIIARNINQKTRPVK